MPSIFDWMDFNKKFTIFMFFLHGSFWACMNHDKIPDSKYT